MLLLLLLLNVILFYIVYPTKRVLVSLYLAEHADETVTKEMKMTNNNQNNENTSGKTWTSVNLDKKYWIISSMKYRQWLCTVKSFEVFVLNEI